MTRETKIGLLVGLAFIIVIGILLSDHLTTRGELPAAQLTQVGDNVRTASAVPASANPPITPVAVPTNVAPANPVPTHDELNSTPATAIVKVGPSRSNPVTLSADGGLSINVATPASGSAPPSVTTTPVKFGQPLMGTAPVITHTPVVAADPLMQPVNPGQTAAQADAVANNLKSIKAEKGDTLSRFAAKYLGSNTAANRQAILDANPDLKANPAKVILGHTYLIPAAKPTAVASASSDIPGTVPADLTSKPETKTSKSSSHSSTTTTSYTVRSNDTLWKIADGDPSVVKEIQDLNKDILKGKTTLHPGTTLKIPAKTSVASR